MKPVTVSTTVAKPREQVFDYVELLANHADYMDHMFVNWSFSGPPRGLGARAAATVSAPGSRERAEFEVVESVRPEHSVEEGVSAHGKRRTRGTYRLEELSAGSTRVSFELEWLEVPRSERLLPALSRIFLRRGRGKSMGRLAKQLERG